METALVKILNENGLKQAWKEAIEKDFAPFFNQAEKIKKDALAIVVTSVEQVNDTAAARKMRLQFKAIRVNTENTRKAAKAESLSFGRLVDSVAKLIKGVIVPIEAHLQEQEDFIEKIRAKEREELKQKRIDLLRPLLYEGFNFELYNLDTMKEEKFQQVLEAAEKDFQMKLEVKRQAEEDRKAKEEAEAKEKKRIEVENKQREKEREAELQKEREKNERLEKERIEAGRLAQIKLDKERQENEAILKTRREEAEKLAAKREKEWAEKDRIAQAKLEEERKERIERERIGTEKVIKIQAEANRKLAEETAKREKVEAELKEKKDAEEAKTNKEAEAKLEKERKLYAEQEAARMAPDRKKLAGFAIALAILEVPTMSTEEGKACLVGVMCDLDAITTHLNNY